jgi:hypothetical protein
MNIFQRISRGIIRKSFYLSVWTIENVRDSSINQRMFEQLQKMPAGTLGKEIADCLAKHGLRLIPKYESHDLKHVLLGFGMTPVDEIRMQAFMLGNGNYSFPSFAIFIFGAFFLPDLWPVFYDDYSRGRKSKPISKWTIEEYALCQTIMLRNTVLNYCQEPKVSINMKSIIKIGVFTTILLGIFGMVFSLPFLFSAYLADLIGAGFAFIGSAIIASAGLLALANFTANSNSFGRNTSGI